MLDILIVPDWARSMRKLFSSKIDPTRISSITHLTYLRVQLWYDPTRISTMTPFHLSSSATTVRSKREICLRIEGAQGQKGSLDRSVESESSLKARDENDDREFKGYLAMKGPSRGHLIWN